MSPRFSLVAILASLMVTVFVISGAAVITLAGSDPQPYEKNFAAFCYRDLVIEAPLDNGGQGNDFKVREVIVSGNFDGCAGYTILLTAYLTPGRNAYAFHELQPGETSFSLSFVPGQGDGQWHKDYPSVLDGELIPEGPLTPPPNELPVSDISWFVSDSWR